MAMPTPPQKTTQILIIIREAGRLREAPASLRLTPASNDGTVVDTISYSVPTTATRHLAALPRRQQI